MARTLTAPARIHYSYGCLAPCAVDIELRPNAGDSMSVVISTTNLGTHLRPSLYAVDPAEALTLIELIAGTERDGELPGSTGAGPLSLRAELDGVEVTASFSMVDAWADPAKAILEFARRVAPERFPEAPPGPAVLPPPEPMFTPWELVKLSLAGLFALAVIGALIYAIVTS